MNFERIAEKQLIRWKNKAKRKPLVLNGARQVGKTFLLKAFGKSAFENVAYFNFEEQPLLKQFFENNKEVESIINNLSVVNGSKIMLEKTLIIFDEIQECNEALNSLKYFNENAPGYAIVAAGSLLGITLSKPTSFPVGKVEFLQIFPLTFGEFLNTTKQSLKNYIDDIDNFNAIPDLFFEEILQHFKTYLICGGMPEVANNFIEHNNIEQCKKILNDIINSYRYDFSKHAATKDVAKINYIWNSIPSQLSRENKKFLYQTVKEGARAREYEDALEWLQLTGLSYKVNRIEKPHFPISSYEDLSAFKIYVFDVGILRELAKLEPVLLQETNTLFKEFKGSFIENYILQSLMVQFETVPKYWSSENKAEVDFVIQYKNEIIPIEVKSDDNVKSKSLTIYEQKYKPTIRIRYSLKNLQYKDGLLNIPLFLADRTKKLLDMILENV
jgi:uncharacterized protein